MRQTINIDNLARLARERNDEPSWRSLWNGVLSLPAWFGTGSAEQPSTPLITRAGEGGKPVLFAFTDEPRARRFINNAAAAPGGSRLMTVIRMPLPDAVRYAAGLAQHGVEHIVFNASRDVQGFGFPIASLAQLAASLGRPVGAPEGGAQPADPGAGAAPGPDAPTPPAPPA